MLLHVHEDCLLLIMVPIDSTFEYDSNGCHIVLLREISVRVKFLALRAVVAGITSFLTETIDNFWFITSSERVFRG